MTSEEGRISTGKSVIDIAFHYYIGLTGMSEEKAKGIFATAVSENDGYAESALRLAEHEVLHS